MQNLVKKESKFAQQIEKYKEDGYTCVELTFYGSSLGGVWTPIGWANQEAWTEFAGMVQCSMVNW